MSVYSRAFITTSAPWEEGGHALVSGGQSDENIPDPDQPAEGYVLIGAAATAPSGNTSGRLFWFWKLERIPQTEGPDR